MILQKDLSLSHFFVPSKKEQRSLVMLLHGYGSNAEQLLNLTTMFKYLKHTSFVIPNAPSLCSNDFIDEGTESEDVYQWFPLRFGNHGIEIKTVDDIANTCKIVEKFMYEVENKYKVKSGNISFFGFSQGAIISLFYSLYNQTNNYCAIVAHSGAFFIEEPFAKINTEQNIMLIHGKIDYVVPFSYVSKTIKYLDKYNIKYQTFFKDDLGHYVDDETISRAEEFLLQNINKNIPKGA